MDIEDVRGALARGYCAEGQTHKVMDPDLCEAQAQEIMALLPQEVEAMPDNDKDPYSDFAKELSDLLNRHSIDNRLNTPDFLLADMIVGQVRAVEDCQNAYYAWSSPKVQKAELIEPNPQRT